jgi:hypothetical protein
MLDIAKWEWMLWGGAAFVATVALVQLMLARRDDLIQQVRSEFEEEIARKREEERRAKQKAGKAKSPQPVKSDKKAA